MKWQVDEKKVDEVVNWCNSELMKLQQVDAKAIRQTASWCNGKLMKQQILDMAWW